jgi:MarR family transcriptional regulator, organic hydroperoxide resistance regulator
VKASARLDLDDYLPYLVNRVGAIIAEQFAQEALAPHRLSIAMWRVMAALASHGSQRQIDLAVLTSIEPSTLSRLVTRMARRGLVARANSARSNREVAVNLSAKGRALVARLIPLAKRYEGEAVGGLTRDELSALKRCLRLVYANMKDRAAGTDDEAKAPLSGSTPRAPLAGAVQEREQRTAAGIFSGRRRTAGSRLKLLAKAPG